MCIYIRKLVSFLWWFATLHAIVLIIVAHNELYIIVHTLAKIMFCLCFHNPISVIIVKSCFENMISQIIKHNFNRVTIITLVSSNSIVL